MKATKIPKVGRGDSKAATSKARTTKAQPLRITSKILDLQVLTIDFKLPTGRGDEFAHGGGPDPRDKPKPAI